MTAPAFPSVHQHAGPILLHAPVIRFVRWSDGVQDVLYDVIQVLRQFSDDGMDCGCCAGSICRQVRRAAGGKAGSVNRALQMLTITCTKLILVVVCGSCKTKTNSRGEFVSKFGAKTDDG